MRNRLIKKLMPAKVVMLFALGQIQTSVIAEANTLQQHKEHCAMMGFTSGTEKFANCVMTLFNQGKTNSVSVGGTNQQSKSSNASNNQEVLLQQQQIQQQNELKSEIKKLRRQQGLANSLKGLEILNGSNQPPTVLETPKTTYCNDFGTQINCVTY